MVSKKRNQLLSRLQQPSFSIIAIAFLQFLFIAGFHYYNINSSSSIEKHRQAETQGMIPTKSKSSRHHLSYEQLQAKHHLLGNVFVCITGQRQRLELHNKIKMIFNPLREAGYEPHVALLLTDEEEARYTNTFVNQFPPVFDSLEQAHNFLIDQGFHVTTQERGPIVQPSHPLINKAYQESMRHHPERTGRIIIHGRQFHTLSKCGEEMANSIQSDSNYVQQYDFSIRLREDIGLTSPLQVNALYQSLYTSSNQNNNNRTVIVSDCRSHGGMNDRMAIVSREASYQYFHGPFIHWYTKALVKGKVQNPESYLLSTYETSSRIRVLHLPILRFVVKLEPTRDGSLVLLEHEEKTICPKFILLPWLTRARSTVARLRQRFWAS